MSTGTKRGRILAVDDTPENLMILEALLEDRYALATAADGAAALRAAAAQPQPDLVLLDVHMPGMNGFEVLQALRADPATAHIPVIFLTAANRVEEEQRGFDLGAIDYITKPLSPPVVLARIHSHLERCEQARRLQALSDTLGRYLPPQVCQAVLAGAHDGTVATSRKKLTVFFSDIRDFTALTARAQPEDITEMLNCYFSEMTAIVEAHGGTLNKFIGDGMMVFFGDPDSRGVREDALQCVRMACAMQRRMRELQSAWAALGFEHPFEIRCGINTGYCDVGNFGSHRRMDYTIMGAEVNKASRLEQAAPAGGILLSRQTLALVGGEVAANSVGMLELKGLAQPVEAFAVILPEAMDAAAALAATGEAPLLPAMPGSAHAASTQIALSYPHAAGPHPAAAARPAAVFH